MFVDSTVMSLDSTEGFFSLFQSSDISIYNSYREKEYETNESRPILEYLGDDVVTLRAGAVATVDTLRVATSQAPLPRSLSVLVSTFFFILYIFGLS